MQPRWILVTLFLWVSWVSPSTAADNLARGKAANFDPPPNYHLCTDPDDKVQLADGVAKRSYWGDTSTVGWLARGKTVLMDVDLGAESPIDQITFNTSMGIGSGVTFPAGVLVYTSVDGKQYHYLCDVINEHATPEEGGLHHTFRATDLKGWGRYVRLAIIPGGFYIFCDEIEIIAGRHGRSEARYLEGEAVQDDQLRAAADALQPRVIQKSATLSLLAEARAAALERRSGGASAALVDSVLHTIETQRRRVLSSTQVEQPDYLQGPPYRSFDRAAFEALGKLNAKTWPDQDFVVWRNDDWSWLRLAQAPKRSETGKFTLRVEMMNNEWATASFVVTSASEQPLELLLSASTFNGPTQIPPARLLEISEVVHVEASGFSYRDDALVPLTNRRTVLPPGTSKRIWLTFKTRGGDLEPGTYRSTLTVANASGLSAQVPIELQIWPMRFPDQTTLQSCTWGYFNVKPVIGVEKQTAKNLVHHYNTTLVLNNAYVPYPKVDAEGNFLEPLDFTRIDQVLDWNPQTRLWLLWPGFGIPGLDRLGTPAYGTPLWEKVFTRWVTEIRDHLLAKGLSRQQFAWYWVDEPGPAVWESHIIPCSKLLKSIDPKMLVWANFIGVSPERVEAALPYIDLYCPVDNELESQALLDVCHRTRLPSWQYTVASSKNQDPFGYYRRYSWKAWRLKMGGIGMWVYVDDQNMTFSDYAPSISYGMVYRRKDDIISSKRFAAWRQGIADYEYLHMLEEASRHAAAQGASADARRKAQRILDEGAGSIAKENAEGAPVKAAMADKLRREMLECIAELQRRAPRKAGDPRYRRDR